MTLARALLFQNCTLSTKHILHMFPTPKTPLARASRSLHQINTTKKNYNWVRAWRSHEHYCFRTVIYQQSTFYTFSPPQKHNFLPQRQLFNLKSILFSFCERSGRKKVSSTVSATGFGTKKLTFLPPRQLGKEKSMLYCFPSCRVTKKYTFWVGKKWFLVIFHYFESYNTKKLV